MAVQSGSRCILAKVLNLPCFQPNINLLFLYFFFSSRLFFFPRDEPSVEKLGAGENIFVNWLLVMPVYISALAS